jgi:hypothetical protein
MEYIRGFNSYLSESSSSHLIGLNEIRGAERIEITLIYQYRINGTDASVSAFFDGKEEELGDNFSRFNVTPSWGRKASQDGKTCEEILGLLFDREAKEYIMKELEKSGSSHRRAAHSLGLIPSSFSLLLNEDLGPWDEWIEMIPGETYYIERGSDS